MSEPTFSFLPYPLPSVTRQQQTLTSITRSSLLQTLTSSTTTPPRPATSTAPTATTLQRAVTTVTVHVSGTLTPTPSSSPAASPTPRDPVYGDMTASYIILLFLPVAVLFLMAFSQWHDSRRPHHSEDIELQPRGRYYFPWKAAYDEEVPPEVSSSPPSPCRPRVPHSTLWPPSAWEADDGTTRGGTPSWGRRHTFSEVGRYPSTISPRPSSRGSSSRESGGGGFETQRVEGGSDSRRIVVEQGASRKVTIEEAQARKSMSVDIVDGRNSSMVTNDEAEQIYGREGSRNTPSQPQPQPDPQEVSPASTTKSADHIPSYYLTPPKKEDNNKYAFSLGSDSDAEEGSSDKKPKEENMSEKRAGKQPARSSYVTDTSRGPGWDVGRDNGEGPSRQQQRSEVRHGKTNKADNTSKCEDGAAPSEWPRQCQNCGHVGCCLSSIPQLPGCPPTDEADFSPGRIRMGLPR
ncbi:hypothetical protein CPLU01_11795 [Colletotrichum plurivorum]|uniref:Uncharacterized protein n=1 Tax=Colletotrichum plurivorum TaxID=2175906 RepID=A0A8H6N7S3_9PEZI|nr:hypothetical protein CPLU01_11795 [Colletotrichum plurivorum]